MDQDLMVGVLLIIVGLALGLFALAIVINRRAERAELQGKQVRSPEGDADVRPLIALDPAGEAGSGLEPPAPPPAEPEPVPRAAQPGPPVSATAAEILAAPTSGPASTAAPVPPPPRELIAQIYREPGGGGVVLRAGPREFRRVSEIDDARLRAELVALFWGPADVDARRPAPRVPAGEAILPARDGSRNMLQGIDAILQRALEEAGLKDRGVRLMADAAGGVKVLIGLKSYALDDVPDEQIKGLIRQSVAEWEAAQ